MSTAELWAMEPAEEIRLRPWQDQAVEALREGIRARVLRQILAAPTGSGKTVMGSHLIDETAGRGKRAVFVCDRIPLIEQTSKTFDRYGIAHGVIQGQHWRLRPWERIQVASAQTLQRRGWPDNLALIVVDEAHTVHETVKRRILQGDCAVVGLTATPFTKGLGQLYQRTVTVRTTNQLIADGYLAPYRIFAASEPDMTGVKVRAGEFDEEETATRAMPIIGDIVSEYLRHGQGKKFIAFGVNVDHCAEIQRQMMAAGVVCGLYTYNTGDAERAEMIRDFARPDSYLQGLVSVSALAKGFDNPAVEVVIMARPLRSSLAEHIQIFGRGLRTDPANPDKVCTILDHAGNCVRFWDAMQDFFENGAPALDDGKKKDKAERKEKPEREPYKCPKCSQVHPPRPMCPHCGHEYPKRNSIAHMPGQLNELSGLPAGTREDKQAVYSQLLYMARDRGYAEGWAAHKFKIRYGAWPDGLAKREAPPSRETQNWVRAQAIAFARSKRKVTV